MQEKASHSGPWAFLEKPVREVADAVGVNRPVVAKWEARFRQDGMAGLEEARRSGNQLRIAISQMAH